jgi:hypothetical protein
VTRPDGRHHARGMTHDPLERLASLGGLALGASAPTVETLAPGLAQLLGCKNGFFAFESALHVFPAEPVEPEVMSVQRWNDTELWRYEYGSLADGLFFFAEDVFGVQFALGSGRVVSFDPETGDTEAVADDVDGWAARILSEYEQLTAHPVAHAWQEVHGPLAPADRLLPKLPFVAGGEFTVENLHALEAVEGMRARGAIATQINRLPEGTQIRFEAVGQPPESGARDGGARDG